MNTTTTCLADAFADVPDPRSRHRREHRLIDILVMSLCATIAGANGPVQIERFGRLRLDWLRALCGAESFKRGVPSHDTIGRVFAALDFEKFAEAFIAWVMTLPDAGMGKTVAVDGKRARRSGSVAEGRNALHMVSAWSCEASLCLGQVTTEDKSNEITAIPQLLDWLDIHGCLVTIDAMGCQREIAAQIVAQEGDYLFGLKGNQSTLHEDVRELFDWALKGHSAEEHPEIFEHHTTDGDHGRIEERHYRSIGRSDFDTLDSIKRWPGLQSFVRVDATRQHAEQISVETRLYISSLPASEIERLATGIRSHWGVENCLHWVLDMGFREDENRCRVDNSQANLATIRRMALNLLKKETTEKVGIETKRQMAGWSPEYLEKVLRAGAR
jgi:predicted transposase YbfD/YdcC